jgi:hypothetical protein
MKHKGWIDNRDFKLYLQIIQSVDLKKEKRYKKGKPDKKETKKL